MKKLFLFLFLICLLVGCATTNNAGSSFNVVYDDISDTTVITHNNMKLGYFYNLKDSATGERENIRIYIIDSDIVFIADYQNKNWLHINEIVLLGDNGSRLVINNGEQSGEIVRLKNVFVREKYISSLNDEQINSLLTILSSDNSYAAFVGTNGRTEKLEIPQKVKAAMIETIEKLQ